MTFKQYTLILFIYFFNLDSTVTNKIKQGQKVVQKNVSQD